MLHNIITAYRAQIYDRTFSDYVKTIRQNPTLFIIIFIVLITLFSLLISGLFCNSIVMIVAGLFLELIAIICFDRYLVKQYRNILQKQTMHLSKVVDFLQTVTPEVNLYNSEQIKALSSRLTDIIEKDSPLADVTKSVKGFFKTIVFPIVTYIAGVYSSLLQKIDPANTLFYGVVLVVISACLWLASSTLSTFLRPLLCRDFDAAVSLREDLLDLQLLYFPDARK